MIPGSINPIGQATVPVSIMDEASGQFVDFNLVIDTGFNGDVQLPTGDITRLNLPFIDRGRSQLADGRVARHYVYRATALWLGNRRTVRVLDGEEGIPLIGANLLWGTEMTVQWEFGGRVSIEPIPRPESEAE